MGWELVQLSSFWQRDENITSTSVDKFLFCRPENDIHYFIKTEKWRQNSVSSYSLMFLGLWREFKVCPGEFGAPICLPCLIVGVRFAIFEIFA